MNRTDNRKADYLMFLATLVLAFVLIAPTPSPMVSALQISPVSTCDDMVIGLYNPGKTSVTLTPVASGVALDPIKVPGGQSAVASVPAVDGLTVALQANTGVQLGPWQWNAPPDCSEVLAPGVQVWPAEKPRTLDDTSRNGLTWLLIGGLVLLLTGIAGIVKSRPRSPYHHSVSPFRGKHRRPNDGLIHLVWQRIR